MVNPDRDLDTVKDRITTIIGFTGLLLGVLVNTISRIDFNVVTGTTEYLRIVFLAATFCLTVCIITAINTFYAITDKNNIKDNIKNPAKLLKTTIKWLTISFLLIGGTIPLILYPDKSLTVPMIFTALLIITIIYETLKGLNYETLFTEAEEQSKKEGN